MILKVPINTNKKVGLPVAALATDTSQALPFSFEPYVRPYPLGQEAKKGEAPLKFTKAVYVTESCTVSL